MPTVPAGGRLIVDVSSLVRWTGPPVGIMRVEAALAAEALRRDDAVLAVWDAGLAAFRSLQPRWAETLIGWSGALEPVWPEERGRTRLDRLRPSRLSLVTRLERIRLAARRPVVTRLAGLAQAAILAPRRHSYPWRDNTGRRIANVPAEDALGRDVAPGPGDVVLSAGAPWSQLAAARLGELKRRAGFAYASLCYDLIPITHPQFYRDEDVRRFEEHWRVTMAFADLLIVNASAIATDVARFCRAAGLPPVPTGELPLGCDPPRRLPGRPAGPGLAGLAAGRYALFVSTIEPRKGHAMLLRVWRRLLERGLPQQHDFRLVFVGRLGWMVDELLAELARPPERLHHLQTVDDAGLASLYESCAFCLYPSVYEGFGLPLVEAFSYGKAVLASDGGALPQTASGRAMCLPASDEAAWEAHLAAWITDPDERAPYEARIAAAPPVPTWPQAASAMLDHAARLRGGAARPDPAGPERKPGQM